MLSRSLKRVLCETSAPLPPTFLLPWTANLSTPSTSAPIDTPPPPPTTESPSLINLQNQLEKTTLSPQPRKVISSRKPASSSDGTIKLSKSMRELLPVMQSQGPHYITAHIHGNPYLLTQGDTVRLPFYMHGVEPGDVIRLDRAVNLGSRDYTLKAPAATPQLRSPTKSTVATLDPTSASLATSSRVMPEEGEVNGVPHFIPHIAKGKFSYIDDRLYECRAVVMGVESEPLRIKEKTKRRQRHTRKVKSKHRFTILKVKEVRIKGVEEIEGRRV